MTLDATMTESTVSPKVDTVKLYQLPVMIDLLPLQATVSPLRRMDTANRLPPSRMVKLLPRRVMVMLLLLKGTDNLHPLRDTVNRIGCRLLPTVILAKRNTTEQILVHLASSVLLLSRSFEYLFQFMVRSVRLLRTRAFVAPTSPRPYSYSLILTLPSF
ncbi:hypothetical protein BC830DRAFT_1089463 [Chytriomyces sp. MP71]|nr:hypothetical protein BC830DRAFT_1089463 [Chytriomyces sp. MP71]